MPRSPARAGTSPAPAPGYCRNRDLPKLLPLWPHELADTSIAGRLAVLRLLRRALTSERQRGIAGRWDYDLARHRALVVALRREAADYQRIAARHPAQAWVGSIAGRPVSAPPPAADTRSARASGPDATASRLRRR